MGWLRRLRIRSAADVYLIFVAAALPWQNHQVMRKGITLFHVINAILLCVILVSLMSRGPKPRWYLVIPVYVYWVGSILGMFSSEVYSINIYTLAQDIYLYVWFVTMCVLLRSDERVDILAIAWALTLVFVLGTEGFIAQGGAIDRGEFSFRNPNRAAAYLTLTFFILLRPAIPLLFKVVLGGLVAIAVGATASAAGTIGLGMGVLVFFYSIVYAKGPRAMRPLLVLGVCGVGLLVAVLNPLANKDLPSALGELAPTAAPRIERSAGTREEIWVKGLESFRKHPLGIGPASFHRQIDSGISDDGSIELHSDFVASLVERGIVGLLGHILLLIWVAREVFRGLTRSYRFRDVIWASALAGATTTYFFYSITHEALHHETFWLLLALIFSHVQIMESRRFRDLAGEHQKVVVRPRLVSSH